MLNSSTGTVDLSTKGSTMSSSSFQGSGFQKGTYNPKFSISPLQHGKICKCPAGISRSQHAQRGATSTREHRGRPDSYLELPPCKSLSHARARTRCFVLRWFMLFHSKTTNAHSGSCQVKCLHVDFKWDFFTFVISNKASLPNLALFPR